MKALLTLATAALALLSFTTLAQAQTQAQAPAGCATVEIQNLRVGQGPLMLAAYSDAATFRKTAATQMQVAVTSPTMTLSVCGLRGDAVAITLYQDLNANGRMDANPFGMPTEPWGASGKPAPMGPAWDSAQVPVASGTIVVKLAS
jgi:uncharacterized protein (DUF2141 family)